MKYKKYGRFKNETVAEKKYFKGIDAFAQVIMDENDVEEAEEVLRHMIRSVITHANAMLESDWSEHGCRIALLEARHASENCGQDFWEILAWTFPDEI